MERESFEDEEVAKILNSGYISIKVDREERPDIDNLYMNFCQVMTGHGGWPLTVIMTPDKKPFFAVTYFPKYARMEMHGLMDILLKIKDIWAKEPKTLRESGEDAADSIIANTLTARPGDLSSHVLDKAYQNLKRNFDSQYGGFGPAPKFPSPHNLSFLLRYGQEKGREEDTVEAQAEGIVETTLEAMYKGGIFDHIGFGFSRYSTDAKWLVPHFEKMLYDNALLAIAYLECYQVTKRPLFKEVAEKIFTYVLRDMTSPEGGFYSAEDADSEGVEGKFYVWTPEEVKDVLDEEKADLYCLVYNITKKGNFEGKNIPSLISRDLDEAIIKENADVLERCRLALFKAREKRVHPYKDDKILTAWNGLMIAALARGARILDNSAYLAAAGRAIEFIFSTLKREDGRLLARYRDGEAAYPAYLDDYAFLVWGLLELYKATYRPFYLEKALKLNDSMLELFADEEHGGFFMTGIDAEKLLTRTKESYDGAMPSGNSVAAMNLLQLSALTGNLTLEEKAEQLFRAFGGDIKSHPVGYSFFLQAFLYARSTRREVVIVENKKSDESQQMLSVLKKEYLPHTVSVYISPETAGITKTVPYLEEYKAIDDQPAAYVCEKQACQAPFSGVEELKQALRSTGRITRDAH